MLRLTSWKKEDHQESGSGIFGKVDMFITFIDDSGSDPSQHVANATGLIIPVRRIVALQNEWNALKVKEQFRDFHTSVFIARNPRSDFGPWSDEHQRRVFRRVREIIKKFGVKVFSFSVYKKDYAEVVPAELRKYTGRYHYTWAMRHLIAQLASWRIALGAESPLEYVFDWMDKRDPRRTEIETVMKQGERVVAELGRAGEYSNYNFQHRADVPGLQCVDCLAWTCYQYGLLAFHNKPLPEFADVAWRDFCAHQSSRSKTAGPMDWFTAATITRDNLETWIQKEIPDGTSLQRFKQWEDEDSALRKT